MYPARVAVRGLGGCPAPGWRRSASWPSGPARCSALGVFLLATIAATWPATAALQDIRRELARRFEPSQIEIRDPARAGEVTRRGRILTLAAEAVPAKPFRVVEVGRTHRVRRHVMDFARVDITPGSGMTAEAASLTVVRGTRMVILEITFDRADVRMLAHTAEPLAAVDGDLVYGCTEFVFHFPPSAFADGAVESIVGVIEHWLEGAPVDRTCREGIKEICLEP